MKFLNNVDLNLNQLQNVLVHILASDPGSPTDGQVWYNSTTNLLKVRENGVTIQLGRLDQISAPTASVNLNSQKITSLLDGTSAQDAVTKNQLDAAVLGMDLREEVRVAAVTNGTLASAYENGDVVDGVTLATGDRILLAGQTAGSENGIYTVNASGAPTRATDFDSASDAERGILIPVAEGTSNKGLYLHTTAGTITLGTTALVFIKVGPSSGGAGTVTKFSGTIGNGSSTAITVNHALGTTAVIVAVYRANAQVYPDISITDSNNIVATYAVAPTTNQDTIVVTG